MLILDLWGVSFHAVVVFGLGKNISFKSILGLCEHSTATMETIKKAIIQQIYIYFFRTKNIQKLHVSNSISNCNHNFGSKITPLKVSRSQNNIVELQLLTKIERMNLFFYPHNSEILET